VSFEVFVSMLVRISFFWNVMLRQWAISPVCGDGIKLHTDTASVCPGHIDKFDCISGSLGIKSV